MERKCKYCGKLDYEDGGNEHIHEHHPEGRHGDNIIKTYFLCGEHHDVAESRNWIDLPFSDYQIRGRLFDIYVNGSIEIVMKIILSYCDEMATDWRYKD